MVEFSEVLSKGGLPSLTDLDSARELPKSPKLGDRDLYVTHNLNSIVNRISKRWERTKFLREPETIDPLLQWR